MNLIGIGPGMFRLILAMAVSVSHLSRLNIGETAVFVFFMLSGFWVTRMYREKYSLGDHPLATFWLSRFLRIWVLYAVIVIFFVLLFRVALHTTELDKWPALFLLGVASHGKDVLGGVSWSLDIELQFYLFLPVIVVVLETIRGSGKWGLLLLGSAGLTVLGWYVSLAFGITPLLAYLLPFVIGSLIYLLDIRPGRRAAALSICVFVGLGLAIAILPQTRGLIDTTIEEPFNDEWFGMIWASLLAPFVAFNVRRQSGSLDRHMGNLSYSVYLLHNPLYVVIIVLVSDSSITLKLILLAMTIPVSLIPYLLVDLPLARRRGVFVRFLITRWYAQRWMRNR